MTDTDLLAQLKDIHLPDPVSWWPLAPGWYLLFFLVLFLSVMISYYLYKKHVQARAKKQALILLKAYQGQYEQEQDSALGSARISELLRRVALAYYPRAQVASLRGEAWLHFLNQTGSKNIDFTPIRDMLLDAPFKTKNGTDITPLFHTAKLWIKQRKAPCSN